MLQYLLFFISGLAANEWFPHLFFYCLFLIIFIVLTVFYFFQLFQPNFRLWLIFSLVFMSGFIYPVFYERVNHSWQLKEELIKKKIKISGYVDSIPKGAQRFTQFEFITREFNGEAEKIKLKLNWYNTAPKLHSGEMCSLTVSLKPPHGLKNPGAFDFEKYLRANNIRAAGYVVDRDNPHCSDELPWSYFLLRARESIQNSISKAIKNDNMTGLIAALTVGSRTEMTTAQWRTLQNTGTSHLMAISGLHVAFIAGLIYFIVNFLWRLFPFLLNRFPAQKAAALISMLAAIVYGLLAGFSLPTQRAVIMIVVLIGFEFFNKSTGVVQRLVWAAALILFFQPLAISQVSFWLSFAAVAWICFGVLGYQKTSQWRLWMRVQWVCFLGLLPITLLYFQQISLVMFFANGVAIPWVGFVIVPLCFLASGLMLIHPIFAQGVFYIVGYLFWPLWKILTWLGALPYATWQHIILNPFIFITSMLAVILFLAPRAWPGRYLGVVLILPLFFYFPEKPGKGEVWLTVLDVGQGLATVIQTAHHTLVYDAGPKTFAGFDSGEAVVLPYLRRFRVRHLDMMIISHSDNDHLGGAATIAKAIPTQSILTSNPIKLSAFSAQNCHEGQEWEWDGVNFRMLNPTQNEPYLGNNSSCVLQIRAQNKAILLPGDIEKAAELQLVEKYGESLRSTVLVAPHHGSKTSSSERFLAAIQATDIIAANGFYNQFKFPSPLVLARYAAFHAKLHDTAREGAIQVRIASGRVTVKQG